MANVLSFITNLINSYNKYKDSIFNLSRYNSSYSHHQGKNSANNTGAYLEEFIKDTFSNSLNDSEQGNIKQSLTNWKNTLLDSGDDKFPPDALLKDGTAIEVKKMTKFSQIQLNSSPFHHDFSYKETRISDTCRKKLINLKGNNWEVPILYIIGRVPKGNRLNSLIMFYGSDLAENNTVYNKVEHDAKNMITPPLWRSTIDELTNLKQSGNFDTSTQNGKNKKNLASKKLKKFIQSTTDSNRPFIDPTTSEIGRVNNVDTLGTYLRIRGMWILPNPKQFFVKYIPTSFYDHKFSLVLVMSLTRWNKLQGDYSELNSLSQTEPNLKIHKKGISLKNPSNPANPKYNYPGVIITFSV